MTTSGLNADQRAACAQAKNNLRAIVAELAVVVGEIQALTIAEEIAGEWEMRLEELEYEGDE